MKKFIAAAVIAGAITITGISTAHAGVACLNSAAACAAILDYLLSSTGNDVDTVYLALKNRVNTSSCPSGSSATGLYTSYFHSHDLDSTDIVQLAANNVSCFVCQAQLGYSAKLDGYSGVCEPEGALGWNFYGHFCAEPAPQGSGVWIPNISLWEASTYFLQCGNGPGTTKSACKSGVGCLW